MDGFNAGSDRVEVVAGMDVDAARLAAFCDEHSIPARYESLDTLLAEEKPDLVSICTPPGTHAEQCVAALEAGAWAWCEKPLCVSVAEMDVIEAAEKRTGGYCASVFQWRFGSAGKHVKGLIDSGDLGKPLVASLLTTWHRGDEYYAVPWRGSWETESGGVSMIHGIHAMDFVLWLMGEWREVRAMMGTLDHDIDVEDVSMACVRFANGAMGSITNSVCSPRESTTIRLDTTKATIEMAELYGYSNEHWEFSSKHGLATDEELEQWRAIPGGERSSHAAQLADILDCMDTKQRPITSGPGVRGTIEFLASLYKSAITGQPVMRGSIVPGDPFYNAMNGTGDQSWQNPESSG